MEKLIKIAVLAFTELRLAQRISGRFSAAALCAVFAFFTGLGMLGCSVAAFWLYLAPRVGNAEAALWSAVALMIVTGGLGISATLNFRGGANRPPLLEDLTGEVVRAMSEHKGSALISALLAGLAFGRKAP